MRWPSPSPTGLRAAPPWRRRGTLGWLLAGAALLLAMSWLRPLPREDGLLFELAGRPVDLLGGLQDRWQRARRDCAAVPHWPAGSARWQAAQQALAAYSPPASLGAQPVQVLGWQARRGAPGSENAGGVATEGDWLLAEVRWQGDSTEPLDPAIVPLRHTGGHWEVQAEGVWSGDTGPWNGPVLIRHYLHTRLPALPAALAQCLDPSLPPFNR
jgi:hypothetical protein